jgi:transmembrane sensor
MSDIVRLRTRAEIDEEAAQWTWRMDSETVTASERQAFDVWLRQDPRHRRAYEEFGRVWSTLDGLAEARRDAAMATFTRAGLPQQARADMPRQARADMPRQASRRLQWGLAAAIVVPLVVAGGVTWLQRGREVQALATAVGQQRSVTLADGSIIALNTNTIVDTEFNRHTRQIYLRQGEAHFQVAHDRSRPFFVHAGDAVVRAVGTQFDVRLRADHHVDIAVDEGRVEVQAAEAAPDVAATTVAAATHKRKATVVRALRAGEALSTAANDYAVRQISEEQLSNDMAWRAGEIIFDGQTLGDAVAEIERYTDSRIVIADSQTAMLRVGGRFRIDNVPAFFDALQSALPVSIRRAANGEVFIDPR